MELSERHIQTLEKDGYSPVYEWFDEPGKIYEPHSHEHETKLIITEGSMEVAVDGETKVLGVHDLLLIPKSATHTVTIGQSGCKYVVSERE